MKSWFGSLIISSHHDPVEATVLATERSMNIGYRLVDNSIHTIKWNMGEIRVSFDMASQSSKIINIGQPGVRLLIAGKEPMEYIEQEQAEERKPWHKKKKSKHRLRTMSVLLGITAVVIIAYFLIVPWLSEKLASNVPVDKEAQFGNAMYDALALSRQEEHELTLLVNSFYDAMNINSSYSIRIKVVNSDIVNAFAMPGGIIVVYTGVLKQLQTYPELAALLSHEFIHIEHKHSTKSIFRQLGSRVFLGLLFGNFGAITSILVNQAEKFKSLNYSRAIEKEADMHGLTILKERKIDPGGFASLFIKLKNASAGEAIPEFLASHPDIDKRIEYIHAAISNDAIEENNALLKIFEKIKTIK